MINKILSAIIAAAYLGIAYYTDGGETSFRVGMYLILPIACIWYGESMGSYTGSMSGDYISTNTPGCLVVAGGWLLLLLPAIIGTISYIRSQ